MRASAAEILKTLEVWDNEYRIGKMPVVVDDNLKQIASDTRKQLAPVLQARVSKQWLKDRIMTLLMHWHNKETPQQIINAMSSDWIDVLQDFPQWAIEEAIVDYNKTSEYKPVPANIVKRAEQAASKYQTLDFKCKLIMQAGNTAKEKTTDAESKARVSAMMDEVRKNMTQHKDEEVKTGYKKLN